MNLLEVKNLSISINGAVILQNINFEINEFEKILIIGPNGAGKSTLLKALAGIIPVPKDSIYWLGKPLESWNRKELAKLITFIPQILDKMSYCTVYEFVLMSRYCHKNNWFDNINEADLDLVNHSLFLTNLINKSCQDISTLSGGEMQKLLLASAIAQESAVWLLDEPDAFLDYKQQKEFRNILYNISKNHSKTYITVIHDLNKGFIEADKVIALKNGTTFYYGCPKEMLAKNLLQDLYEVEIYFQEICINNIKRFVFID